MNFLSDILLDVIYHFYIERIPFIDFGDFFFSGFSKSFSGLSINQGSSDYQENGNVERTISNTSNFEDELEEPPNKKMKKKDIITPRVVATLDRTGVSSRNAAFIITAVAQSLGHNVEEINLSYKTIDRKRNAFRRAIANDLKENLITAKALELHWDGKLMLKNDGSGKIEKLPIVISGYNTEQLLGSPQLKSGSGLCAADAIEEILTSWGVTDKIKAFCFDTTSTNTGKQNYLIIYNIY